MVQMLEISPFTLNSMRHLILVVRHSFAGPGPILIDGPDQNTYVVLLVHDGCLLPQLVSNYFSDKVGFDHSIICDIYFILFDF